MTDWQPIETAPQDGTPILATSGQIMPEIWRWESDMYATRPNPSWLPMDRIMGKAWARAHQPTHWMPLPEPPKP